MHSIRRLQISFSLVANNDTLVIKEFPLFFLYLFRANYYTDARCGDEYSLTAYLFTMARLFQDVHPWLRGGIYRMYSVRVPGKEHPFYRYFVINGIHYPIGTHVP